MGYYKWKPSASQKKEYREKMLSIEAAKSYTPDGYTKNCTGDCCVGDEITFFQSGKSGERLYGLITADSYGAEKQQHTFTILLDSGERTMIKGRNLYENGVSRKEWENEADRQVNLDEKHERGTKARAIKAERANIAVSPF